MQRSTALAAFVCLVASTCISEEVPPACELGEVCDDISLLQVVKNDHVKEIQMKVQDAPKADTIRVPTAGLSQTKSEKRDGGIKGESAADSQWPGGDALKNIVDIAKKGISGVLDGAASLEDEFDDLKAEVNLFQNETNAAVAELKSHIQDGQDGAQSLTEVVNNVEKAYTRVQLAATKLLKVVKETNKAFLDAVDKFLPAQLKSAVNMVVTRINEQGQKFVEALKAAHAQLKDKLGTGDMHEAFCAKCNEGLLTIQNRTHAFASSFEGLRKQDQEVVDQLKALGVLPEAMLTKAETFLHKGDAVMEQLSASLEQATGNIVPGVEEALERFCPRFRHGGLSKVVWWILVGVAATIVLGLGVWIYRGVYAS